MAALYLLPDETQYRKLFSASAVRPVVVGSLSESTIRPEGGFHVNSIAGAKGCCRRYRLAVAPRRFTRLSFR
jgi:hypothetical protein